jgi:hypothetical protein
VIFVTVGTYGSGSPRTLHVSGRSNANVSMAVSGNFLAAVWSASTSTGPTDIFSAVSTDGGRQFSAPVQVNSTAGQANVNGEQPPRVALSHRAGRSVPDIVVVWTAKGKNGTNLLTARSTDGGKRFSRTSMVPGTDAPGNRGWEGVASDAAGRVSVAWLDHRRLAKPQGTSTPHQHRGHTGHKGDGVEMAQRSHLFYGSVDEPGSVRRLTGGVCYCCKTAIAAAPSKTIALAWRHVFPGNLRDIAFSISRDDGRTFTTPVKVSEDNWQIDGCPDDGPALAVDAQGVGHVVWPTRVTDAKGEQSIGIFYATSRDGSSFSQRLQLPTDGVAHHPQLALAADGSPAFVWDELIHGPKRHIAFARLRPGPDGKGSFVKQIVSAGEPSMYPVLAPMADERFLVAWTATTSAGSTVRVTSIDRRD